MAKLYILPLIDETAKREKLFGSSDSYSTYLSLPFENVLRPMFLGGIKHFAGDEQITLLTKDTDTKYAELYEDGMLAYNTNSTVYLPRSVKKLNPYFIKSDKTVKKLQKVCHIRMQQLKEHTI